MTVIKSIKSYPLPAQKTVVDKPTNSSRIIIIDRSGSMHYEIGNVIDNVIEAVNQFPKGDMISIGWFSTEGGTYRFEIIGYALTDDRSAVVRILNKMRSVINLTCFSEILTDARNVMDTLQTFDLPISLIFHSDGYPVVRNYTSEENKIFSAIKAIRSGLSEVTVVGYGEYYNRELLSRMADALGGKLVHSQNWRTWETIMKEYVASAAPIPRIKIETESDGILFDKDGNVYQVEDGAVFVSPEVSTLFRYDSADENTSDTDPRSVYIAAKILLTKDMVDQAIDLLTELGDVAAAEKVSSAWTPEEFGKAAEYLDSLAKDKNLRFAKGCHPGQKPDLDAPCLLDAIDALVADSEARLWIGRGFNYKKIGVPHVPVDGTPEFVQADDLSLDLNDLVWNEKRLNLSARFVIPGHAMIGKNDLGLPEAYPCIKFRTFSIVTDGRLNVTSAPFSMSRTTFEYLKACGVVVGMVDKNKQVNDITSWFNDAPYMLDFTAVPLVNGSIVLTAPDTETICDALIDLLEQQAYLRVLNAKSKILKEAGITVTEEGLTPEQQAFLESKGIVHGVFRPKMVEGEASDQYIAPTLDIAIKSFSSIPHPDKIYEKQLDGKKLTPSEELVAKAMSDFDQTQPRLDTAEKLLEWIESQKHDLRSVMTETRADVQRAKFAVMLGHRWFAGVDRNNPIYDYMGYTFNFKLGQQEIAI